MTSPPSAGWFPDPTSRHDHRYFDGHRWTDHVSDAGVQSDDPYVAPLEAGPPPPPPPPPAPDPAPAPPPEPEPEPVVPPAPVAAASIDPVPERASRGPGRTVAFVVAGLLVVLVVVGIAVSSGGSDSNDDRASGGDAETVATKVVETPTAVPLDLRKPRPGAVVKQASVVLSGRTAPGTEVVINETVADVDDDGVWTAEVELDLGENQIVGVANAGKPDERQEGWIVERKRSAAEVAEGRRKRAAARRRAEARRQQRVVDFKNSATTIPYNQLAKDPDRYVGDKVTYTGKILQIQEEQGYGGLMLLYVTDEGYDIWDDIIWVDYTKDIKSAEDDIVTVYGRITGEKSYETQIGGETFVPQMQAKYIDE